MNEKSANKNTAKIDWNSNGNNKQIISDLKNHLLYTVDEPTQKDFENILKYDFNPKAENANQVVMRLVNAMVKMPEYQLI